MHFLIYPYVYSSQIFLLVIFVCFTKNKTCVLFQLQVKLQANKPQPEPNMGSEDDIDRALSELQMSLEGSHVSSNPADIMQIPELADYLKFMKCVMLCLVVDRSSRIYC